MAIGQSDVRSRFGKLAQSRQLQGQDPRNVQATERSGRSALTQPGRGGTLGLLSQRLAMGIGNRKKKMAAQQAQSQQGMTSQVMTQKQQQVGGLNPPII